ncbi:unnamed protein product, partial [Mesorhabditis belari]|uniref:Uncharacterized protein n=1 Tax=Mesorhabditis belari TaxID=2138241 RepID=A0AAF3F5I8_9BILA
MPTPLGPSSSRESVEFSIQLADASCPACLTMCLVSELSRQSDSKEATAKCASCEGRSRVERMRVCRTCARSGKINIRKAKRDEVSAYVFCSDCAIEKHLDQKHEMDKYMNYYNRSEMENISEKVRTDVTGVRETVLQISENAQAGAQKWIHDMNKICRVGLKIRSADECHRLREQVNDEIKKVEQATDELLTAQRKYIQSTEESRENLRKIMDDLKKTRRKENGGGIFARFGGLFSKGIYGTTQKAISAPAITQEDSLAIDGKNE